MKAINKVVLNLRSPKRLFSNVLAIIKEVSLKLLAIIILTFLSLPLIFKYRKDQVPFRQLLMLDTAIRFSRLLDKYEIDYVLILGSLLGAVRQQAFAGRPIDFDIAVKKRDRQKLLNLTPIFKDEGISVIQCQGRRDKAKFKILAFPNLLRFQRRWAKIDIQIYVEHGEGWRRDRWDLAWDLANARTTFDIIYPSKEEEFSAKIFSYKFRIPVNYEQHLVHIYGEQWKIPDSVQYAWRK